MKDNGTFEQDQQFRVHPIEKVEKQGDGWALTHDGGWCIFCPSSSPIEPKKGMVLRLYGKGIGFPVRGMVIDGQVVYYKTEEEQKKEHEAEIERRNHEQKDHALKIKAETDARIAKLPVNLRNRIEKFRKANPNFWWEYMDYELSCCEDAASLAEVLGHDATKVEDFRKLDYKEQKKIFPGMFDGHSGNSFDCMVALAYWLCKEPGNVEKMHGALATLVGCEAYGCHP